MNGHKAPRPKFVSALVSNGVGIFGLVLAMLCLIAIDFFHTERLSSRHVGVPLSPPAAGAEVDIVVAPGGRLIPLEVKLSATPRPAMARNLTGFQKDLQGRAAPGYVIHPGE